MTGAPNPFPDARAGGTPVVLSDGVVTLRCLELHDVPAHLAGEDEDQVRWLTAGRRSTPERVRVWIGEDQQQWREHGTRRHVGIRDSASGALIGNAEAHLALPGLVPGEVGLSYAVFPDWRGRGVAARAVRLLCDWLGTSPGHHTAVIRVAPGNAPSHRVAVAAGFTHRESAGEELVRYERRLGGTSELDDHGPAPVATRTALVVAVPAAEAVVGEHRRHLDSAAGWGVPAHVTVLVPFLEPGAVDEAALEAVAAAVATVDAFDCTFATTGRFGAEVLWLAPRPDGPLRRLTAAVWAAFPGNPPYGGAFADVVPHLTVGESALSAPGALDAAEAAVRPRLPVVQRVEEVLLIAGSEEPRSWRTRHRFPLGDG